MNINNIQAYGQLCSLFYDVTEKYASQREVDFFAACIEKHPGRVLEAMSGSGRLQIPLLQRGYVVDGVDHSDAMLARCRQRCARLGLALELYEQSVENLALPHTYGTVIIAVGSLQLITDQDLLEQALAKLHEHMMIGGNLFIDIFQPDITIDEHAVRLARLDEHRTIRLTKRHRFDQVKKIAHSFCLYELMVDGIVAQQENELVQVAWRSDGQWQELLHKVGFQLIQIYDARFNESEPSRVIHAKVIKSN